MSKKTKLEVKRIIYADKESVFKALTSEKMMEKWFYPSQDGWKAEVSFEPREGASYQVDMINPDGKVYSHKGVVREVKKNSKLEFTWNSHAVSDTVVTITLNDAGEGTEVTLVHDFMPQDEKEAHEKGWTAILTHLSREVLQ